MLDSRRLIATLCIALALLFAGASLSSAMDQIQHASGAPAEHQHMLFSDITFELGDSDGHHSPEPGDNDPAEHLPGGHHHHGDHGPAMPVAVSAHSVQLASPGDLPELASENQTPGLHVPGPERPPKSLAIRS